MYRVMLVLAVLLLDAPAVVVPVAAAGELAYLAADQRNKRCDLPADGHIQEGGRDA
jgi:hypothetical protein